MKRQFLAVPALTLTAVLLLAPLGILFVQSFWTVRSFRIVGDWNLDNYADGIRDYGSLMLRTVMLGALVAAIAVVVAAPLAYACRFKLGAARELVLTLVIVALFGGYLVRIYAWKTILGESGVLNGALVSSGIIDEPVAWLLYSRAAVVISLVNFLVPLAFLPIHAALEQLPRARIDASHDLGAGRLATVGRLVVPETAPALAAAFALCLVLAASDWVTPTLVGGPNSLMVGQVVATQFGAVYDWPFGSAMAFLTAFHLAVAAAAAFGLAAFLRRSRGLRGSAFRAGRAT